ncbi:MAG: glycosyltransferase family 2 protein [Myxococcales bacterium]|nr:glycosyltransferase [Myxococcales bacterium]
MATVGAVVLTYNKAWILREFFDSLRCQSRRPDEVILVDDASTDGTQGELSGLPDSWLRLKLSRNGGQSRARNIGFRYASCDYVIFLDADVVMEPDMLESLAGALDAHPEASIAYCHYRRKGSRVDSVRAIPWDAAALRRENYVSAISLVRRADLPRPPFDETLARYEDWDLWLRMALDGRSGVLVDRPLFTAWYRPADLSGRGESRDWHRRVLAKHALVRD